MSKKEKKEKADPGDVSTKRARVIYENPGQKKPTPDPLNGNRMFYESLYKEFPEAEVAEKWLLIHGLLEKTVALRVAPKYGAKNSTDKKAKKPAAAKKKAPTKKKTPAKKKAPAKKKTPAKKRKRAETSSDESDNNNESSDSDFE